MGCRQQPARTLDKLETRKASQMEMIVLLYSKMECGMTSAVIILLRMHMAPCVSNGHERTKLEGLVIERLYHALEELVASPSALIKCDRILPQNHDNCIQILSIVEQQICHISITIAGRISLFVYVTFSLSDMQCWQ